MKVLDSPCIVDIARATIRFEIDALDSLVNKIGKPFEQAVNVLESCGAKAVFTGLGKSGIVAKKVAATLSSVGKPAVFVHPVDALHGDLGLVQEGDIVVFVSNSGETPELVALHNVVQAAGFSTIAIVGCLESTLAKRCDISLDASVDREACPLNLAPTSSVIVSIALGDALAACLVEKLAFTPDRFSTLHPSGSLGKRLLLRVADLMHTDSAIPLVCPGAKLREVLVVLTSKGMGVILVAGSDMLLKGIFTDGDLRRCLEEYDSILEMRIDDLMTKEPIVTSPGEMAVEALRLMEDRPSQIAVIPVVDEDNRIQGIIRLHDVVRAGI